MLTQARHQTCSFFWWFPQLLIPRIMALIQSSSWSSSHSPTLISSGAASTMFPFSLAQPQPKPNGKKLRKWADTCIGDFCHRA
ncbi:hypothetical protein DFH29DRAFT_924838 [Suillus ampliporus]|nr:hypothetical protein DFH29DRAFT_924838 [Suillus ampliporus]